MEATHPNINRNPDAPVVPMVRLGCGRGFDAWLGDVRSVATRRGVAPRLYLIDTQTTRATKARDDARALGLDAVVGEPTLGEALREGALDERPAIVIGLDKPGPIRNALDIAEQQKLPTVVSTLLQLPNRRIAALRACAAATDSDTRGHLANLFAQFDRVTATTGSGGVFGLTNPAEHRLLEPRLRRFLGEATDSLTRTMLGLDPTISPIGWSFEGRTALPVIVHDSRTGFIEPEALASRILARPPIVLEPGTDILITQLGPDDAIQIHTARLRRFDRVLSVDHASTVDRRSLAEAIRVGERDTITPFHPVRLTD